MTYSIDQAYPWPKFTEGDETPPRARGYKTFFMLNSVEHEILNATKYKNIKKDSFFLGSNKPRSLFFPLINVKMPTIVGILTFMSMKKSCSVELSMKKSFITSGTVVFDMLKW